MIIFSIRAVLVSLLIVFSSPNETYLVDTFEDSEDFLLNWKQRRKSSLKEYWVNKDSTGSFLSARTESSDMMIIKEIKIDIVEYPYFNWRWRVHEIPPAGDESEKEVCDAPASIAIVVGASKIIPKSIKYTWSSTLPKGTSTKSPYAFWPSRTDIKVIESGDSLKGQWVIEKINILEDYKRLYKKKKVKSKIIKAIAIMSDSDNTNSVAAADYDDLYFSKY